MNIETLYLQAELAQAAYARGLVSGTPEIARLTDAGTCGMTQTQAKNFAEQWRVVDQYTAPSTLGLTGSGFSATVFQNIATGEYVFAVRGTEPSNMNDLLGADLADIGYEGFSLKQSLDLYNYIQSLKTPAGQSYQAVYLDIDLVQSAALNALPPVLNDAFRAQLESQGYWVEQTLGVYTVGKLALGDSKEVLAGSGLEVGRQTAMVQLGSQYDVVGHSLGGHLAMMLGRMDPGHVGNVTTFNPPYFNPISSHKRTDEFFTQLRALDGKVASAFKGSQNYVVENDPVHQLTATLIPGTQQLVFSEGDSLTSPLAAYDIKNITDSRQEWRQAA